ncbi:uncharacterized protein OCT59_024521 [Rhizophagus irregularis]|uniref:Uncharacterized protein n=3 Tax=Rhizophagus irregularis TaxID=588596 RepID=A0A916E1S6_9GLOM|nr:hypothetical protein GLOIN_2v1577817 [Rhizophagus irregularis DAOM 181602=DAOM 197198]UZO04126.1 hypothetical protein OCT59_024521 [Rhizophagus irregularis]POG74323.1 hypothetical protein GLOIN_2v1577817 [Rhizophagus irregularis DAOM 181602=DAOM 197198]CAB4395871.1 unnamed protein product [Rhizophagus irregularis]CAB4488251.1 unnamed protein product [Rhizophagus irregularis]CAB5200752.1 unnamed protein product [Rhizophagus irregularis]|eukprot:XP_025181189.1 hypothetical protein GLOIN_2v1577817 [Rhizophagus irregularis DAOM 181602=DAOM 197198]
MPQQKRKASTIASAKIAEDAGSGRKRKSDAKEEHHKETDKGKGDVETEQNVSDDKKVNEAPENKRRKKQPVAQDIREDNGTNGNEPPSEHDQMLIDEYDKHNGKSEQAIDKEVNKVQTELRKELEKNMAQNTVEKGHICFFYRPKVGTEEVHNSDDVQRSYIVLIPYMVRPSVSEEPVLSCFQQANDDKKPESDKPIPGKIRIITIGKKKLPEIKFHVRSWAYVDKAFTDLDEIKEFVSGRKYQTKTRGERSLGSCRLLGKGVYNIVEHKGHTHLAYVLEFPEEPTEVQDDFNIKREGSYVISVKNPETTSPPKTGLPEYEKVTYPAHLKEKFAGRRFLSLSTTEFMDYDGAELLLIGAKDEIAEELGEAGEELEELSDFETKKITPLTAEDVIFKELNLERVVLPSEPLHGLWK